jgi:hypothetical protein
MGRSDAAGTTYLQILRMAEERKPNYQRIEIAAFRWEVGTRLLAFRPQSSLNLYQSLLAEPAYAPFREVRLGTKTRLETHTDYGRVRRKRKRLTSNGSIESDAAASRRVPRP